MLHHIRQPFLHQSVRSQVDARRKLDGLALDAQLDRQARFPRLLDKAVQVIEAWLRRKSRRLFGPPQHAHHAAHLGERLAPGPLDDEQGLALAVLIGPQKPSYSGRLDGHHADAVTDDVMKLARDSRPLLRNCCAGLLLTFALRPGRPLLRFVGLLELSPEREADDPDDAEDDIGEDEVPDAAVRIAPSHKCFCAEDDRQPRDRLPPIAQQGHEEDSSHPGQENEEVVRHEAVVQKRREDDRDGDSDRRAKREAPSCQKRRNDRHDQRHFEPEGAVQPAVNRSVVVEGGHNPADDPGNDQNVEPVARPQSPQQFHALKVLGSRPFRLVLENDPNIVREDDIEIATPAEDGPGP